jgi:hypothetical protein
MFYLKDNMSNWFTGIEVHLPDGTVLNEKNKTNKYGWEWYEEPPEEYLEWIKNQEQNENTYRDI